MSPPKPPGLEDRLEKESKVYALYGWGIRQSMVRMIGPREVRKRVRLRKKQPRTVAVGARLLLVLIVSFRQGDIRLWGDGGLVDERVSARSKQPRLCRELQSLVFNLNFGEDFVEGSRRRGKKKDQKCSIRLKIIS